VTATRERLAPEQRSASQRVLGFVSTWPVFQGTTIDRYAHALMQGIRAAAKDRGCSVLMGAGISAGTRAGDWRAVWPVPSEGTDLVPVGPWNADGLIVVPDDLSAAQLGYVRDLQVSGLPVLLTAPEAPGPRVVVDNSGGIRQALGHLLDHGHRQIAFVAGKENRGGDSAERLRAFRESLEQAGLEVDSRLIAFGEHRFEDGRMAMERILASGAPFTAFVASNDLSCLGAIAALQRAGRAVPDDVAAIGFDDILDARSSDPQLTTVRHPTFALGYAAVVEILDRIELGDAVPASVIEATTLIVRQSCGCRPDRIDAVASSAAGARDQRRDLVHVMARAAFADARHTTTAELEEQCEDLLDSILKAIIEGDSDCLRQDLGRLLAQTRTRGEDGHAWQSAVSALYRNASVLRRMAPRADRAWILELLDDARLEVSRYAQRETYRALLEQVDTMSRLGLLTSQMLAALEPSRLSELLDQHLPGLGVDRMLVGRYLPNDDDPGARYEVVLQVGLPRIVAGSTFDTRDFPPAAFGRAPLQLLVLPIALDKGESGFVAMSTASLEPAAAIAINLAAALRTTRLHRDALEGRRQAEESTRLKSRFLSVVSHELRTPLSVVVGLGELALREARELRGAPDVHDRPAARDAPDPSESLVHDLERMAASAGHLGRLIDDVLDLASSEFGQLRLALEPVDLAEVLASAAEAGRELATTRGLAFETALPERGLPVLGDRTRLRQVALNLIGNAVKFTERGHVRLEAAASEGSVSVRVSDTGVGIPADEQGRIFGEFQRGARSAAGSVGGLGLGLAIARLLVELHGGTIEVRSPGPNGVGSTFSFRLPLRGLLDAERRTDAVKVDALTRPLEPDGIAQLLAQHGLGPGSQAWEPSILLVDDDPDVIDVHARIVAESGGRAIRASTGQEALAIARSERPDLVVLDLGLPGFDGFRVVEGLRERPATRDVPVIVITGRAVSDGDLSRLDGGVAAILRKGTFSPAETRARIDTVLSGKRPLGGPTRQLVRRAVGFIEEHYDSPLDRDTIAGHVAMSPDYLTDCFRQELGVTPMAYLNRCRIRQARWLLETTDRTITSIAMSVGFSDASHFTRTFHREVGVSPRVYRRGRHGRQ
jgi:signal transduction histidine kinase/DNA-binding LacI/PurR family transcriptional regulator/AraC-like DNA-binding protein